MNKGEKWFFIIIAAMIIAVNPPILNIINNFSENNLLTFGLPTFWLWLEFWYAVGAITFLIAAIKLDKWKEEEKIQIEEGPFKPEEVNNE